MRLKHINSYLEGMRRLSIKIPKDVMNKVTILDCTEDKNIRRLNKSLMKLPFIKDESDLETDRLEKIMAKLEKKLDVHMAYLMRYRGKDDRPSTYTCMLKTNDEGIWLETVHGLTINESLKKAIFYLYYFSQNKEEELSKREKGRR